MNGNVRRLPSGFFKRIEKTDPINANDNRYRGVLKPKIAWLVPPNTKHAAKNKPNLHSRAFWKSIISPELSVLDLITLATTLR